MYGGLFGDLPAAKEAKNEESEGEDQQAAAPAAKPVRVPNAARQPAKTEASVLKGVGTAGTAMAFVPTAALQRRRNNKRAAPTSSSVVPSLQHSAEQPASIQARTTPSSLTTPWSVHIECSNIKPDPGSEDTALAENTRRANSSRPKQAFTLESNSTDVNLEMQQKVLDDPYDPMVPNDLLIYWETKALAVQHQMLERQAQQAREEQQRIRQHLEWEREELQKTGNVDKLVEHHVKRSMGRGRGLSNLPAWLVEKQKKEREAETNQS